MGFIEDNVTKKIEEKCQESPSFKKAWEDSREEYRLIGEMTELRKKEKISQTKLANIVNTKQQSISRIEKHESIPSLRMFCNLLSSLGYELRIVKKSKIG